MRPAPSVLLIGAAGSGKDTVADYLAAQHGHRVFHIADPLKQLLADPVWEPVWTVLYPHGRPAKLRRELQDVGDVLRRWDPHLLVKLIVAAIQDTLRAHPRQAWCIADVRLLSEYRLLHAAFPQARVIGLAVSPTERLARLTARDGAPPAGDWAAHSTERQVTHLLEMGVCDRVIANTGTRADLYAAVEDALVSPARMARPERAL